MTYVDVTNDYQRADGGERWVRTIDEWCWISVSHRLTGFGWMEWETAIVIVNEVPTPTHKDRECLIIKGDRREELAEVPKHELRKWYEDHIDGNRNSFETVIEEAKRAVRDV
jgi:hypothetical protein